MGTADKGGASHPGYRESPPLPAFLHAFIGSPALGLVITGDLRGSSASLTRSSSFVPASAKRRACWSCSGVGGNPGIGGGSSVSVLSNSRAAASRSLSSG